MGLIREIQGVNATIDKRERARREREKLKILQENYKKEIESNLQAEFTAIYKHYDTETAEKITELKKDNIIENIYNYIYNLHYLQYTGDVNIVWLASPQWDKRWKFERQKEKVFLYRDFDIIADIYENYNKILERIKKEFYRIEQIENKKLFDELKNKITQYMTLDNNKYFLTIALQQNENIKNIVEDITPDETKQDFLYTNYQKALKQVFRLYAGDITKSKMKIHAEKENAKNENKKKVAKWLLFNCVMTEILRILPKGFNNKRRY